MIWWLTFQVLAHGEACPGGAARALEAARDRGVRAACALKGKYLRGARRRAGDFVSTFERGVGRGRRVILLGVEHFNFESELYPDLARAARRSNPAVDCFFVEEELATDEARAALELFNDGDSSRWTPDVLGFDRATLDRLARIRDAGLRVHFVDRPGNLSDADAADPVKVDRWARGRNPKMVREIARLMRKDCRAAFYPVGAMHLSDPGRPALPRLLGEKGIASDRMLLLVAGRNSREDEGPSENGSWTWRRGGRRVCPGDPAVPEKSFGFPHEGGRVPVNYDGRFHLDFADFSRTLVYVCPTDACRAYDRDAASK